MDVIVCYAKCWPCNMGEHYDPPQAHGWADAEDIEHAANTGQKPPPPSRTAARRCHGSTMLRTPTAARSTLGGRLCDPMADQMNEHLSPLPHDMPRASVRCRQPEVSWAQI